MNRKLKAEIKLNNKAWELIEEGWNPSQRACTLISRLERVHLIHRITWEHPVIKATEHRIIRLRSRINVALRAALTDIEFKAYKLAGISGCLNSLTTGRV